MSKTWIKTTDVVKLKNFYHNKSFGFSDEYYQTYIIDNKLTIRFDFTTSRDQPLMKVIYVHDTISSRRVHNVLCKELESLSLYDTANDYYSKRWEYAHPIVYMSNVDEFIDIIEVIYNYKIKDLSYRKFMELNFNQYFPTLSNLVVRELNDRTFSMLSCANKDKSTIKFALSLIDSDNFPEQDSYEKYECYDQGYCTENEEENEDTN